MSFFPVIELVDRYCIAELKYSKTVSNNDEIKFYRNQMELHDTSLIKKELDEINNNAKR
jgi:hypothetical protein